MQYLETFRESTLHQGEVLLGMDNHGAQSTALCREFMAHMGIVPAYTPANCTDCVSPVDKNVAETLKKLIRKKYSREFALHRDEWNVGLPESEKRQKVHCGPPRPGRNSVAITRTASNQRSSRPASCLQRMVLKTAKSVCGLRTAGPPTWPPTALRTGSKLVLIDQK